MSITYSHWAQAMRKASSEGAALTEPASSVRSSDVRSAVPDPALAQALIESASVVIYHSNLSGDLTYVNPEYRRIFGLTPQQSTNDWVHGVHPEDRQRIQDAWDDFCRNPRSVKFDYRTKPVNGTVRYFTEQVTPARGVAGFVGTISDFTDLIN